MVFKDVLVRYVDHVFFFEQKTAYELRISDGSSDVCSSDLVDRFAKESIVKVPVHFHFRCQNERRVASRITVTNCGNEDRAAGGCASLAPKYARQKRSCRTPKLRGTRSLTTRLASQTSQPFPHYHRRDRSSHEQGKRGT